jgi:hypothetical protein
VSQIQAGDIVKVLKQPYVLMQDGSKGPMPLVGGETGILTGVCEDEEYNPTSFQVPFVFVITDGRPVAVHTDCIERTHARSDIKEKNSRVFKIGDIAVVDDDPQLTDVTGFVHGNDLSPGDYVKVLDVGRHLHFNEEKTEEGMLDKLTVHVRVMTSGLQQYINSDSLLYMPPSVMQTELKPKHVKVG